MVGLSIRSEDRKEKEIVFKRQVVLFPFYLSIILFLFVATINADQNNTELLKLR